MTKYFLISFLIFCCYNRTLAQRANVVYAEGLGSGLFYSLNYDFRFSKKYNGLGARLGAAYLAKSGSSTNFPIQINYLIGKKEHLLELGAGILTMFQKDESGNKSQFLFPNAAVMYRYQPLVKGLTFRIGWTPVLIKPDTQNTYDISGIFRFWGGISIGYCL